MKVWEKQARSPLHKPSSPRDFSTGQPTGQPTGRPVSPLPTTSSTPTTKGSTYASPPSTTPQETQSTSRKSIRPERAAGEKDEGKTARRKSIFGNFFGAFGFNSNINFPQSDRLPEYQYDHGFGTLKTKYEDCCDCLGVKITDSLDEVKKRFRALALQYHPDKNPGAEAQNRFVEIRKAYEYICDNYSK